MQRNIYKSAGLNMTCHIVEVNMIPAAMFELGERVRLTRSCPIDFEGIGPLPGDVGEVVELPVSDDSRHETGVRFERVSARWEIPIDYLEHTP